MCALAGAATEFEQTSSVGASSDFGFCPHDAEFGKLVRSFIRVVCITKSLPLIQDSQCHVFELLLQQCLLFMLSIMSRITRVAQQS